MSNIEISVIVPIYNSEKYLHKCINSLINQSIFEKIEILLINDGSTDNSLDICSEYSQKYLNIHVFTQDNKGVSVARNKGLKEAKGKFIAFFDSDDSADKLYLESLLNLIRLENADVAVNDFYRVFNNSTKVKYRKNINKVISTNSEILKNFFYGGIIGNNLFDKLFKADIAKSSVFLENYKVGEDMFYLYTLLRKTSTLVIDTSEAHYYYYVNESSAMNSSNLERYQNTIELSKMMCNDFEESDALKKFAVAHLAHEECKAAEYIFRITNKYEDIKTICNKLKNYSIVFLFKYLSFRQFLGIIIMRFSPSFYLFLHKQLHVG